MKKVISLVTLTMLLITMVPLTVFAASGTDTWDGSADTSWYSASEASFTINTAKELAGLAQIVNGGTDTFAGDIITLTNNLNLASIEWTPIGTDANPFLGTFDGGNHSVSNMKINKPAAKYIGLFGKAADTSAGYYPDNGATLKNISVLNVDVVGYSSVGGLVGYLGDATGRKAFIINCHTSGVISGPSNNSSDIGGLVGNGSVSKIENSSSSVTVEIGDNNGGGLVGLGAYATIENSFATGDVTGVLDNPDNIGGLVGNGQQGIIRNSYATGAVAGKNGIGGLVGSMTNGTIANCYATGAVTGTNNTGGLYGDWQLVSASITNSYGNNANTLTGYGVNGSGYAGSVSGASLEQMNKVDFKNTLNGSSSAIQPYGIDSDFNNGFPYLVTIPQIMSGDRQTIKQGETLTIKATMPYADGMGITTKVDGVEVPADKVTYTPGSTITTLLGQYTADLEVGTYSIEIATLDYGTVIGTFTVVEGTPETVTVPDTSPKTGDSSNLYGMIAIAIVSIMGTCMVIKKKNIV